MPNKTSIFSLRFFTSRSSRYCTVLLLAFFAVLTISTVSTTTNTGSAVVMADDNDETSDAEDDGEINESFLTWLIRANGLFFGPIFLLLSFIMMALVIMNILQIRRDVLLPTEFIEGFEKKLGSKDYQGAYEIAKEDGSFIAQVLVAGLSKLNRGYNEAIEGMQEIGEDENMVFEHRLSYLSLIGAIAPMVGLMGTVYGMIQSFEKIANSRTPPPPAELAGGISTALFTTLEGLMIAIPAMVAYSLLRNRLSRFVLEIGIISEGLMSRFSNISKNKGAAIGSPADSKPSADSKSSRKDGKESSP